MTTWESVRLQVQSLYAFIAAPRHRDERGLSQSVETAILIVAALTVAAVITVAVTSFVSSRMASLGG